MRSGATTYEEIKNRIKERLEYVQKDIPMMMKELSKSKLEYPRICSSSSYDVIVVGCGAAGASAAITAADQGKNVLVVDRYDGGGSTRRSGGVVYFGGYVC
jgi:ribulose 1,5-bisphosphate synthetase/thiazole synthase